MANMGYCRFHNTLIDFEDCVMALNGFDSLSDAERKYALRMIELAGEMFGDYGHLLEGDDQRTPRFLSLIGLMRGVSQ